MLTTECKNYIVYQLGLPESDKNRQVSRIYLDIVKMLYSYGPGALSRLAVAEVR